MVGAKRARDLKMAGAKRARDLKMAGAKRARDLKMAGTKRARDLKMAGAKRARDLVPLIVAYRRRNTHTFARGYGHTSPPRAHAPHRTAAQR